MSTALKLSMEGNVIDGQAVLVVIVAGDPARQLGSFIGHLHPAGLGPAARSVAPGRPG